MDKQVKSELLKLYNKGELVEIANELGLEVTSDIKALSLLDMIESDISTNGIPEWGCCIECNC